MLDCDFLYCRLAEGGCCVLFCLGRGSASSVPATSKLRIIAVYHGELNEFRLHEHAVSNKDLCLFARFMVS